MDNALATVLVATVQKDLNGGFCAVLQDPPMTVLADTLDALPRALRLALKSRRPEQAIGALELRLRLDGPSEAPDCGRVVSELRRHRAELEDRGVARLAVFGSVARGEADPESDVDLLVTFDRPVGLFDLADLKDRLQALLHRPVDLTTENGLRPAMRERVLREAVVAIG